MSVATQSKERPILFSGPMVRAILEGRKTQTRRIVKFTQFGESDTPGYQWHFRGTRKGGKGGLWQDMRHEQILDLCPYGKPGDRLWVRETFFCATGEPGPIDCRYQADYQRGDFAGLWKPSIHMPRWASRITLEIVSVRVERLHGITPADAKAEGCLPDWDAFHEATENSEGWLEPEEFIEECEEECDWVNYGNDLVHSSEHQEWERDREQYATKLAFRNLWESINGPESWSANPWVWVVEFRVERRPTGC